MPIYKVSVRSSPSRAMTVSKVAHCRSQVCYIPFAYLSYLRFLSHTQRTTHPSLVYSSITPPRQLL